MKQYTIHKANKTHKIEMIEIKGGNFMMGTEDRMPERNPLHEVHLNDFLIGKYEVTQSLYKFVTGENPSYFKGENLPVEMIRWVDAKEFIIELNKLIEGVTFRLPTEAEWEYAAKGGLHWKDNYKFAGSNDFNEVGWHYFNSGDGFAKNLRTHEVGLKKPNQLGIYDMNGNVYEWTEDEWEFMDYILKNDKYTNDGSAYVWQKEPNDFNEHTRRGGCFMSPMKDKWIDEFHVSNRSTFTMFVGSDSAYEKNKTNGFRLAQ